MKKKIVSVPKSYILKTVLYNGESIAIKFIDAKEHVYVFKGYSLAGESLFTKTSGQIKGMEAYKADVASAEFPSFYSIPNVGYVNYMITKDKGEKMGYQVNFLSDDEVVKSWTYSSAGERIEIPIHLAADSNYTYFNIMKRDALLSTNMDVYIKAFETKTGKEVFEIPLIHDKNKYNAFSSFIHSNGNLQLFGRFYEEDENVISGKGQGLALVEIDKTGKIVKTTHLTGSDKRLMGSELITGGEEDKSKYFYFHNFIRMADGRTIGIGESYSQKVNALGLMAVAAGYGGSGSTLVMEDMYLFEFSPSFDLMSIKRFEKHRSNFAIPGIPVASPIMYGYFVKEQGGFDYSFYQQTPDRSEAAVYYLDYERRKGEANNTVLGAIFIGKDGTTTDKYELNPKTTETLVLQGPFGSVLMMDYYRKEKSLDIRTVKLNY